MSAQETYQRMAHGWAHDTDSTHVGYLRNGRVNGELIYSYNTAMGRRLVMKKLGVVFILNERRYSNTTNQHQSYILNAIPDLNKVIFLNGDRMCLDVSGYNPQYSSDYNSRHKHSLEYQVEKLVFFLNKQRNAKSKDYSSEIRIRENSIKLYMDIFIGGRLSTLTKLELTPFEKFIISSVYKDVPWKEYSAKVADKLAASNKTIKAKAKLKEKEKTKKAEQRVSEWLQGEHGCSDVSIHLGRRILLRSVPGKQPFEQYVQTSGGIQVSEENAITVYRMILRIMKLNGGYSKELVQKMLEKCNLTSIEGWRIDDIESNGNFHSGCHHILWKDIEDFIKRSNLVAGQHRTVTHPQ